MKCPLCKAEARVLHVDESGAKETKITYVCPNPQCTNYKRECGEETRKTQ